MIQLCYIFLGFDIFYHELFFSLISVLFSNKSKQKSGEFNTYQGIVKSYKDANSRNQKFKK